MVRSRLFKRIFLKRTITVSIRRITRQHCLFSKLQSLECLKLQVSWNRGKIKQQQFLVYTCKGETHCFLTWKCVENLSLRILWSKAIDRFPKFLIHFLAKFVFNFEVILSDIKVAKTKLSLYSITMKLRRTLTTSNPHLQNVSMNFCPILPTFQGTKPLCLDFIIYKIHRGIHMPTFSSPC